MRLSLLLIPPTLTPAPGSVSLQLMNVIAANQTHPNAVDVFGFLKAGYWPSHGCACRFIEMRFSGERVSINRDQNDRPI
jgi:hypothetical protein